MSARKNYARVIALSGVLTGSPESAYNRKRKHNAGPKRAAK